MPFARWVNATNLLVAVAAPMFAQWARMVGAPVAPDRANPATPWHSPCLAPMPAVNVLLKRVRQMCGILTDRSNYRGSVRNGRVVLRAPPSTIAYCAVRQGVRNTPAPTADPDKHKHSTGNDYNRARVSLPPFLALAPSAVPAKWQEAERHRCAPRY